MSKRAVEEYEKAEQDEKGRLYELEKELNKIVIDPNDYIGAFVTGYQPDKGTCTISASTSGVPATEYNKNGIKENGDQEFTTEEGMQWRIWDYDGTILTIISSKLTQDTLLLSDATGYNNGVYAINEIIRKCYTQKGLNNITVRNLRRTDIQEVSTYDYTNYKHEEDKLVEATGGETGKILQYGQRKTFERFYKMPIMWKNFDSKWDYEYSEGAKTGDDKECKIWEEENGYTNESETSEGDITTEFKESYYYHRYNESEFKNSQYYDMIFKDDKGNDLSSYWLAGRFARLNESICAFGLHHVSTQFIGGNAIYGSNGNPYQSKESLRPLIFINLKSNNLELVEKENIGESKSYEIKTKHAEYE